MRPVALLSILLFTGAAAALDGEAPAAPPAAAAAAKSAPAATAQPAAAWIEFVSPDEIRGEWQAWAGGKPSDHSVKFHLKRRTA